MKRIISYVSAAFIAAAVAAGCADKADGLAAGEGKLRFEVKFDGAAPSRAADGAQDCVIRISNPQGTLYEFHGVDEIPAEIALLSGSYTLSAEAGTRENSGFETPFVYFYKGSEQFTVRKGETAQVSLVCPVLNNIFTATFDEDLVSEMTDYSFTLHTDADDPLYTLVFDASKADKEACVMFANGQTTVDWAFEAKHNIKGTVASTGTLTGLTQGKRYDLTVSHTIHKGELQLSVTAEESAATENGMTLWQKPVITPVGFDIDGIQDKDNAYEIFAAASSEIASIVLSGSVFGAGYDLLDPATDPLAEYGVEVVTSAPEKAGFTFPASLFEMMTGVVNDISIEVTDGNGNKTIVVFSVAIADSGIENVRRADMWATHTIVKGVVIESAETVQFAYRPEGSSDWNYVPAEMYEPYRYSAKITGLTPATNYEAAIFADGAMVGTSTATFTTEEARQPGNAGLEDYHITKEGLFTKRDCYHFYASDGTKFWDTGNKGATTLGNSVTTSVTDVDPDSGGTRSAKLASAFVGLGSLGKFAAGNIYSGEYAGTSGMDGMVDFGREFTSRPSAMSVRYKATVGTVNYAGGNLNKNDLDKYRILVMLTDWDSRHRVNTGNQDTFLNYDTNPGIIALGEIISSDSVAEWDNAVIDLEYRSLDRVPKYIVIMATASMYGDYFAGSTSSVLWVDDFELIYKDNVVLQK